MKTIPEGKSSVSSSEAMLCEEVSHILPRLVAGYRKTDHFTQKLKNELLLFLKSTKKFPFKWSLNHILNRFLGRVINDRRG